MPKVLVPKVLVPMKLVPMKLVPMELVPMELVPMVRSEFTLNVIEGNGPISNPATVFLRKSAWGRLTVGTPYGGVPRTAYYKRDCPDLRKTLAL